MSEMSKSFIRENFPNAISFLEPEGWAIYSGFDSPWERIAPLAFDQPSEDEAWAAAEGYFRAMEEAELNEEKAN